jgi:cytochrome c biogenesis protein CcmG, thiol:disulfide interchange protein DsbE
VARSAGTLPADPRVPGATLAPSISKIQHSAAGLKGARSGVDPPPFGHGRTWAGGGTEGGAIRHRSGTLIAMAPKRLILLVGALALLALLAVGLVQFAHSPDSPGAAAPARLTPAQMQARLSGSSAPLAALHAQANELLGGGDPALRARLAALRGWPVVINKWASWCQPCRAEFGAFQRVATNLGRRVAFIGIDSGDSSRTEALEFLRSFPVSYPSFYDPSGQLGVEITDSSFVPATVFYDRGGGVYLHQGAYPSAAKLERDVERYALDA